MKMMMYRPLIAIAFLFLFFACSSSLKPRTKGGVEVSEVTAPMSQGEKPGYRAEIYNTPVKDAVNSFRKQIKTLDPDNVKVNGNEVFADNAKIPEMSSNRVDVYARFEKSKDNNTLMTVFYDLGGTYLTAEQNPTASNHGAALVRGFGSSLSAEGMEKTLSDVEGEQRKLKKQQKDLKKKEKDLEKEMQRVQNRQLDNAKRQEDLNKQVEAQQDEVQETKKKLKELK